MHLPERLGHFASLLAAGNDGAALRKYKPRQLLRQAGEAADEILLVRSGIVSQIRSAAAGQRHIVALRYPGEAIFPHERRADAGIEALSEGEAVFIPKVRFDKARAADAALAEGYVQAIQRNELVAYEWLVRDRADSTSRIAHAICETAHRLGADLGRGFEMPFTQAILGEITGQTSVNVNRVLRSFADRGLLTYSRNSIAGDGPELRRLARYDERYLA